MTGRDNLARIGVLLACAVTGLVVVGLVLDVDDEDQAVGPATSLDDRAVG